MRPPSHRPLALFTALAAGAALAVALLSEAWGGLVPCALCLVERWPYRIAIGLGLAALLLPRRVGRAVLWLAVIAILCGALAAGVHVGVELGFWPSPLPECAAPHIAAGSIAERLAAMPALPSKPCDSPTYLIAHVPVSMAAMNLIYALGLVFVLGTWLERTRGRRQ